MMKRSRISAVVAVFLVLMMSLAACSKDDNAESTGGDESAATPTADEYATQVCGALDTWLTTIQDESQSMASDITDAESGKTALTDFLQTMVDSTDTLVADVEAAGIPDVDGGDEAASKLQESLTNVRDILADAQETVSSLDTSDQAAFAAAVTQVGTDLESAADGATAGLDSLSNQELDEAFASNSTCQSLASM